MLGKGPRPLSDREQNIKEIATSEATDARRCGYNYKSKGIRALRAAEVSSDRIRRITKLTDDRSQAEDKTL